MSYLKKSLVWINKGEIRSFYVCMGASLRESRRARACGNIFVQRIVIRFEKVVGTTKANQMRCFGAAGLLSLYG